MSSTNERAAMSPEQERLLHDAALHSKEALSKIEDLHRTLYRNGFQDRLKAVERFASNPHTGCPAQVVLDKHLEEHVQIARTRVKRRWRLQDFVLAIGIAVVAGLPAWVTLVMALR